MSNVPPHGSATRNTDWTSTIVGVGLALLAVLGVLTVFSAPLLALVAPPAHEESPSADIERAPHGASTVTDGGASAAPLARAERDAHS
jgi:hypothetical protein